MLKIYNKKILVIVNGVEFNRKNSNVIKNEEHIETKELEYFDWDNFFEEVYHYVNVTSWKTIFKKDIKLHNSTFEKCIRKSEFKHAKIIISYEERNPNYFTINDIINHFNHQDALAYLNQFIKTEDLYEQ